MFGVNEINLQTIYKIQSVAFPFLRNEHAQNSLQAFLLLGVSVRCSFHDEQLNGNYIKKVYKLYVAFCILYIHFQSPLLQLTFGLKHIVSLSIAQHCTITCKILEAIGEIVTLILIYKYPMCSVEHLPCLQSYSIHLSLTHLICAW